MALDPASGTWFDPGTAPVADPLRGLVDRYSPPSGGSPQHGVLRGIEGVPYLFDGAGLVELRRPSSSFAPRSVGCWLQGLRAPAGRLVVVLAEQQSLSETSAELELKSQAIRSALARPLAPPTVESVAALIGGLNDLRLDVASGLLKHGAPRVRIEVGGVGSPSESPPAAAASAADPVATDSDAVMKKLLDLQSEFAGVREAARRADAEQRRKFRRVLRAVREQRGDAQQILELLEGKGVRAPAEASTRVVFEVHPKAVTMRCGDATLPLSRRTGTNYLLTMVGSPDVELSAEKLQAATARPDPSARRKLRAAADAHETGNDVVELRFSKRVPADVARKIRELLNQLDDAEQLGDATRSAELRELRDQLLVQHDLQLRGDGRITTVSDPEPRQRQDAVRKRIEDALREVHAADVRIGAALKAAIKLEQGRNRFVSADCPLTLEVVYR